ncbi:hypothetical protein BDQ12DRAFT_679415 [Crucibulum laeve]|uniref:Uncharacterized protein n=1 Tax=Crucibulum laeve TaxID=68775 RepID=A0A5C3M957_9AGAR|nr:hypothetical protein BDQ12DRAFT_679415 [Crucibulum laeve]
MARQRDNLPRLNIQPNLHMQQPGQAMFSPALPTAIQQGFHPSFPVANPLQTPMQSFFAPQPPPAPGRPTHRAGQASMAQLAAAGIHPPNGFMTPVMGHFPRPSMMLQPGQQQFNGQQPFIQQQPPQNRHRKQLSIGGPPKAVLGGPARKLSPLPVGAPGASVSPAPQKVKKHTVNLPKETVPGEEGEPSTRPEWARSPLADGFVYEDKEVPPVETVTAEQYPPEIWRRHLPDTLDVFLPGKINWDSMKNKVIEEKLEKLGVERGSGSSIPHIHAPHARAASISSPADPALLLFKLNKLQQSQGVSSAGNSLSASPQPPFGGLSPSSQFSAPKFMTNRHGHTMSLAQPPTYQPYYDQANSNFNPFANSSFGSDPGTEQDYRIAPLRASIESIHAPQGRVPVTVASLAPPPLAVSRPDSRPDFTRGFGLDIPEEEEEEEEELNHQRADEDPDASQDMELDEKEEALGQLGEEASSAPQSRHHSRHVSRLSAAMSIRSLGRDVIEALEESANRQLEEEEAERRDAIAEVSPVKSERHEDGDLEDAVGEWTGSEDVYLGGNETSDDESIGEWSNPSDEERARQQRVERRIRRKAAQQLDKPRRLPNFPRPPESTIILHAREDDIISNPSDEGRAMNHHAEYLGVAGGDYYSRPDSSLSNLSSRPLPPLPHSRVASGQYSVHDPAHAHSRMPSDSFVYPTSNTGSHNSRQASVSLNPFAKPFVFGALKSSGSQPGSGSWPSFAATSTPPGAPIITHSRLPSVGKPLNVAAPEFKPGGFTFRPPPGVPQMPTPLPAPAAVLSFPSISMVEMEDGSPFKVQGREKRQRRASSASVEEGDSMVSFKFPPNVDSPRSIRRSTSFSGSRHMLNPSAEPFTFAGFSVVANGMPHVPHESDPQPEEPVNNEEIGEEILADESTAKGEDGEPEVEAFILPSASKPKRAPIPLDFKHPVSSNTVPAGLFKALVNGGDDRTRRAVRSRLSSREIYEHIQRPSMDDIDVPQIARKVSRARLVTDPGTRPETPDDDVFGGVTRHTRRRSSLPDALHDDDGASSTSRISVAPQDLTTRMELHQLESVLGELLDEKLNLLRREMSKKETQGFNSNTEDMIADVVSLFRTQLQDSAIRSIEDSQMDARGEMDFQLIKDVVEEGHKELLSVLRHELQDVVQAIPQGFGGNSYPDVVPTIEQIGNRTVGAVLEAISELSARQEAINNAAPARERDAIVDKLMNVLGPTLASLQTDPVDYDFLTSQLTQAVKPHITQLIDLASDKRETASLIVDRILPLLPSLNQPALDIEALTLTLTTEVRRAIAPIDAFEIKEQVADLVVERLDSRLAVRDKAFNVDTISGKVTEGVSRLLQPLESVQASLDNVAAAQQSLSTQQNEASKTNSEVLNAVSEISSQLDGRLEALNISQADLLKKLDTPAVVQAHEPDQNILAVKTHVQELVASHRELASNSEQLLALQKDVLDKVISVPASVSTLITSLQNSLVELITSRDTTKRELEELRKNNTDYQVQLAKARGQHGQVRVEKDVLSEKLGVAEGERDRLRAQVKELQTSSTTKTTETTALEARNKDLEEALSKALARLQSSDVASQSNQNQIADLEKANRDLLAEKQALKSKADSLEMQVTFANRDKETATESLEVLRKQHDRLSSQQNHWDDLRQAAEKIDMLTNLIGQADNEELKELRRYRERTKALESDHITLQKRFKDLEAKLQNSERAATTSRQSLAQAQQRSSEWERRAKEYEGQLELTKTQLEQAEQTQTQLDADYSLVKLQLEEREADERLTKDRENKLLDQISQLEVKTTRLQAELEKAKTPVVSTGTPYRNITNGNAHPPPRPDSRASTIYDARSVTPNRRISSYTSVRSDTPPQASVWDSMHAPTNTNVASKYTVAPSNTSIHAPTGRYPHLGPSTPKARRPMYAQQYQRPSIPSPTPSNVSAAPTLGDDGWYS